MTICDRISENRGGGPDGGGRGRTDRVVVDSIVRDLGPVRIDFLDDVELYLLTI